MKLTAIQTANFIGARAVDVTLAKPVMLFAGKNFAGKSSVQEAVRMALTGESARVALKKDYGALITEGADSGFATVAWTSGEASVVLPSGKRNLQGSEQMSGALPFVLDAQRFAKLSTDDRRQFLFGLMGLSFGPAAIGERLLARGCDKSKVDQVAPMLRAGFDAAHKEAQAKARECKAQWKTTTGGETYGSNKAGAWAAQKPAVDAVSLAEARTALATVDQGIEAATVELGSLQGRARQHAEQSAKLAGLREKAGRYARIADKLAKDEADLAVWEKKVGETRAKATSTVKHSFEGPCPCCGEILVLVSEATKSADAGRNYAATLKAKSEAMPGDAGGDPESVAALPEYERALSLLQKSVANDRRDLAEANAAAEAIKQLEDGDQASAPSDAQIEKLQARIATLKAERDAYRATIRRLEDAQRQAEQADETTAHAAALHATVQAWEVIADALAPDGIQGDMLAEALGPINDRLMSNAMASEWEAVIISSDMRITYGTHDYALISESEKWRADAMIAEAVSHLSGVKLLVLDRFDVLDMKGREDALYWLSGMAQDGEIDTALLFGTLKALPAQLPEGIGAVWIENGVAGKLEEAA